MTRPRSRARRRARYAFAKALVAAATLTAACGGGSGAVGSAFNTNWENDGGRSIADVQRRLASATLPAGTGVAVGVTPKGLIGAPLDGSATWKHAAKLDGRPAITGNVVVGSGSGQVFALDAQSGKVLWTVSSDGRAVRGAGDDGSVTVVSLGEPSGGGSLILAVDRSGNELRRFEPEVDVGVPAVLGGVAFVPWGNQYVSAIEIDSGNELGRLLMRDKVSHAINIGGSIYFGELAVVRFDDKIGQAPKNQANRTQLPERELAGTPVWLGPGSVVHPVTSGAPERVRLFARPVEGGLAAERLAATYFRVVMGLNAKDGTLRWARTLPHDVIGGAAADGGFAACDATGKVWLLAARAGGDAGAVNLGEKLSSCVVQGGSFKVPEGKDTPPLAEQVGQAIKLRMPQMVTAQRFLLRELGALEDESVTKVLVDLASDPQTPPMLLEDSRQLLASRRNGAEYMIAALERRYDFLADVLLPPPVGPIADALSAMNETRAAQLLAEHLNDPANTPDDVQRAARALTKLATKQQYADLRTFFALYRAAAAEDEMIAAVISTAQALIKIGGKEGAKVVTHAASDPLTHPQVREGIKNLAPSAGGGAKKPKKSAKG